MRRVARTPTAWAIAAACEKPPVLISPQTRWARPLRGRGRTRDLLLPELLEGLVVERGQRDERAVGCKHAVGHHCRNANVHLRVVISVRIPEDRLRAYYPKIRQGLKALWGETHVK